MAAFSPTAPLVGPVVPRAAPATGRRLGRRPRPTGGGGRGGGNGRTAGPPAGGGATTATTTSLNVLLDVPPYFFTITLPMLGIVLSLSKAFGRLRMEERAWEQRLEEARERRLRDDPALTELELRRREAALEWSAYGKPREEEEAAAAMERELRGRRRRVKVLDRDDYENGAATDDDDDDGNGDVREHRMSDDEINLFEVEYGVDYDPYYDDPYSEDELPQDVSYQVDRRYGDRIYSDGEIFYKDKASGLYYRQGAKPRNLSFWQQ